MSMWLFGGMWLAVIFVALFGSKLGIPWLSPSKTSSGTHEVAVTPKGGRLRLPRGF